MSCAICLGDLEDAISIPCGECYSLVLRHGISDDYSFQGMSIAIIVYKNIWDLKWLPGTGLWFLVLLVGPLSTPVSRYIYLEALISHTAFTRQLFLLFHIQREISHM